MSPRQHFAEENYGDYLRKSFQLSEDAIALENDGRQARDQAEKLLAVLNKYKTVFYGYPDYAHALTATFEAWNEYTPAVLQGLHARLQKEGKRMSEIQATAKSEVAAAEGALAKFPNLRPGMAARLKNLKYGADIGRIESVFEKELSPYLQGVERVNDTLDDLRPGIIASGKGLADFPNLQRILADRLEDLKKKDRIDAIESAFAELRPFLEGVDQVRKQYESLTPGISAANKALVDFPNLQRILTDRLEDLKKKDRIDAIESAFAELRPFLAGVDQVRKQYESLTPGISVASRALADFPNLRQTLQDDVAGLKRSAEIKDAEAAIGGLQSFFRDVGALSQKYAALQAKVSAADGVLADFSVFKNSMNDLMQKSKLADNCNISIDFLTGLEKLLGDTGSYTTYSQRIQNMEKTVAGHETGFVKNIGQELRALARDCGGPKRSLKDTIKQMDECMRACTNAMDKLGEMRKDFDELTNRASWSGSAQAVNQVNDDTSHLYQRLNAASRVVEGENVLDTWREKYSRKLTAVISAQEKKFKYHWPENSWGKGLFLPVNLVIGICNLWISIMRKQSTASVLARPVAEF